MDTSTHRQRLAPATVTAAARATDGLGALGEELAARHLAGDDGLEVLARNWRLAAGELRGELDLVAEDRERGQLVVCEVKTRRDADRFGGAIAAVGPAKAARVRALTVAFLRQARLGHRVVRFDVVAVDLGRRRRLVHVEGAM